MRRFTNYFSTVILLTSVVSPILISAEGTSLPSDDHYVQVKDGHLDLAGQRVRY